jgi:dihydropteroate synthase
LTDKLYIQPLALVPSPQAVAGDALRLAGGMAYAI